MQSEHFLCIEWKLITTNVKKINNLLLVHCKFQLINCIIHEIKQIYQMRILIPTFSDILLIVFRIHM